ncbi:MAG: hypothetical protein V3S33_02650 [Gammaproteobacteria bacterium]
MDYTLAMAGNIPLVIRRRFRTIAMAYIRAVTERATGIGYYNASP